MPKVVAAAAPASSCTRRRKIRSARSLINILVVLARIRLLCSFISPPVLLRSTATPPRPALHARGRSRPSVIPLSLLAERTRSKLTTAPEPDVQLCFFSPAPPNILSPPLPSPSRTLPPLPTRLHRQVCRWSILRLIRTTLSNRQHSSLRQDAVCTCNGGSAAGMSSRCSWSTPDPLPIQSRMSRDV